jgi:hypothetical protein
VLGIITGLDLLQFIGSLNAVVFVVLILMIYHTWSTTSIFSIKTSATSVFRCQVTANDIHCVGRFSALHQLQIQVVISFTPHLHPRTHLPTHTHMRERKQLESPAPFHRGQRLSSTAVDVGVRPRTSHVTAVCIHADVAKDQLRKQTFCHRRTSWTPQPI